MDLKFEKLSTRQQAAVKKAAERRLYQPRHQWLMGGRYGEVNIATGKALVRRGWFEPSVTYGGMFRISPAGDESYYEYLRTLNSDLPPLEDAKETMKRLADADPMIAELLELTTKGGR